MNKRAWLAAGCLALMLLTPGWSQVNFNFTFDDVVHATGVGFDDPTLGSTRRTTLTSFVNSAIGGALNYTVTVNIEVNNSLTSGTGFLASAGALYSLVPNSFQDGLVHEHITTGTDPNPGNYSGSMTWNFGYTWAVNTNPGGSEFDFRSVALHELTHALGFASVLTSAGASQFGGANNTFTLFDSFLSNGTTPLINPTSHTFQVSPTDLVTDVFFTGAAAEAAYGGPVPVYTPGTFASGSSLSHWDEIGGLSTQVMSFSIAPGEMNRSWSALELGALSDLGYSITAIPEPGTSAALAGLCALGLVLLRRRCRVVVGPGQ